MPDSRILLTLSLRALCRSLSARSTARSAVASRYISQFMKPAPFCTGLFFRPFRRFYLFPQIHNDRICSSMQFRPFPGLFVIPFSGCLRLCSSVFLKRCPGTEDAPHAEGSFFSAFPHAGASCRAGKQTSCPRVLPVFLPHPQRRETGILRRLVPDASRPVCRMSPAVFFFDSPSLYINVYEMSIRFFVSCT